MNNNNKMYYKYTKEDIENAIQEEERKEFVIISNEIRFIFISTKCGRIFRKMKSGFWKEIENKENHKRGYNVILIGKKQYMRSKLIICSLKNMDFDKKYTQVHHINKDKLDCSLSNLVIK